MTPKRTSQLADILTSQVALCDLRSFIPAEMLLPLIHPRHWRCNWSISQLSDHFTKALKGRSLIPE